MTQESAMTYEWQDGWVDIADVPEPEYVERSRRAVMAAVNWIAEHPKAQIRYQQRNLRRMADAAGVSPDVPLETIFFSGAWEDYIKPETSDCRQFCRAIAKAVIADGDENASPTFAMMRKAMLCAQLFHRQGWDEFSKFMFTHDAEGSA
jgi:hypothetical protein